MKKTISMALVLVMLVSLFAVTASAKEKTPFGTVVEAKYTTEAPDMSEAMPDASWGTKVIHVDKDSKNAGITDYSYNHPPKSGVKADQTTCFDMYARWTDDTLYLCFVSPEKDLHGAFEGTRGDGFQILMIYGIVDISTYSKELCSTIDEFTDAYGYCVTFWGDDDTVDETGAAMYTENMLYWNDRESMLILKMAIPFSQLGASKKDVIDDGSCISLSMLRIEANSQDLTYYTGWLEWGDFFSPEKGLPDTGSGAALYPQGCTNPATTTANTIKLVGKKNAPATSETPTENKVTLKGTPSGWAKKEVEAALEAGLIPEEMTDNLQGEVSRANLSKILSLLIDKVYGKAPTKTDAKFTDTTDADVLKAANLGIINGYPQSDGSSMFKPNNTLKRCEIAAIVNRVANLCGKTTTGFDSEVKFDDTTTHWCKSELGWPVHMEIIKGTAPTKFNPDGKLTVEQTIAMIYRTYEALK